MKPNNAFSFIGISGVTLQPFFDRIPSPRAVNFDTGDYLHSAVNLTVGPLDTMSAPDGTDTFYAKSLMALSCSGGAYHPPTMPILTFPWTSPRVKTTSAPNSGGRFAERTMIGRRRGLGGCGGSEMLIVRERWWRLGVRRRFAP